MGSATGNGLTISVNDNIVVAAQGLRIRGDVVSVNYYDEAGWYIEITNANVPGGYSYWKQRDDGGHVIEINGISV
jgi:hypothetical protein